MAYLAYTIVAWVAHLVPVYHIDSSTKSCLATSSALITSKLFSSSWSGVSPLIDVVGVGLLELVAEVVAVLLAKLEAKRT